MQRHRAGDLAAAEPLYLQVLAARPDDPVALHYYGLLCHGSGRPGQAEELIRRAIALDPTSFEAHSNLGVVLKAAGRLDQAVEAYGQAIRLRPDDGIAHYNLGNALLALGRVEDAAAAFRRATRQDPHTAEFHNGLGEALRRLDRTDEAVACLTEALRLRPDWADCCNSLGACAYDRRDFDTALAWYGEALRLDPAHAEALKNLGAIRFEQGDLAAAVAACRRSIAAAPDYVEAHFYLACALLRLGELREGLAEYEWRRRLRGFPVMSGPAPEWRGEPLAGKTLLLYGEQGLGDVIQFSRYAAVLARSGARVLLRTRPPLVRLMRTVPGLAGVVADGEPVPDCDYRCPVLSVPHFLGTELGTIPAEVPYVQAEPAAVLRWGDRLAGLPGLKVGLAWSGDPRPDEHEWAHVDRRRSLSLAQLAPLAGVAGVTLISLQKGVPAGQIADAPAGLTLVDVMDEMTDFADTAALVANLDLVITVDTSVAHLVGAMAKPVWILSRFDGCWRWLMERDDSPWYPTARLFRQAAPGAWAEVIERVAAALRQAARPTPEEAAVDSCRQVVRLHPDDAAARYNLGNALIAAGRVDEAAASFRRAVELAPDCAEFRFGEGACHYHRRDLDGALACCREALRLDPRHAPALKHMGTVLSEQGDHAGAVAAFRRSIAAAPDYAAAHFELGCALLRRGEFAEGLAEYEWRRRHLREFPVPPWSEPEWRGEPLAGKTILLYGEQGLGDGIQFSRYASVLARSGARVLLAVQPPLVRLLATVPGVAAAVAADGRPIPRFDYHVPLLSVPRLLGTELATIPAEVPYVHADPQAVRRWADRLAGRSGLKVGLVWSGDPHPHDIDCNLVDRRRSLRLADFLPLAGIAGVTLVSLQKGPPAGQLADAPAGLELVDVMDEMTDFADTAALVATLDLVITVDTSVAHLAGAMAKPVWILSRFDGCWRWLLERDDSPWYPTARLFRQAAPGDWSEVVGRVAAALRQQVEAAPALFQLGCRLDAEGDAAGAADAYQRAIAADPGCAEAYINLGVLLLGAGMVDEAAGAYWRAAELRPDAALVWYNLANALSAQGRPADAAAALVRAIEIAPAYAEAASNLGGALIELGRYDRAATACRYALSLRPDHAEAHSNLGLALAGLGRVEDAVESYGRAIALAPDLAQAHANLGDTLLQLGRFDEAIAACRRAVALRPDFPEALAALAHIKQHACLWDDCAGDLARLLAADRRHPGCIAPLVLVSLDATAADQLNCAAAWAARFHVADDERCPAQAPHPERARLRIGYLSADFHQHATTTLATGLFESHDRSRFEVFGYSTGPDDGSDARRRVVAAFDHFVDLREAGDAEAARRIHADGIDILVDLKGYTQHARTHILASRPAPLQVNYLGFPGTMGAGFIDYVIADPVVLPPALRPFFTERTVLLPGSYQCNDGRRDLAVPGPDRAECGLPADGFVFCCFNNTYKIVPAVFAAWMRLLDRVPGSVLWLLEANPLAAANLRREAAARGVSPDRLVFAPWLPLPRHLARYALADLFLDTLPCAAHTTASDALWAGLPLLTCAGATFAGRVAASLLTALGLPELVAASPEEYEAAALRLARRPDDLTALRRRLHRARTETSVFDPAHYARAMESAFTRMWQVHAEGGTPQDFSVADDGGAG